MTSKQAIEQGLREGLKRCGTSKEDINKILNGVKVEIKEKEQGFGKLNFSEDKDKDRERTKEYIDILNNKIKENKMIEKSEMWCCEVCGKLIKGMCHNNQGYVKCIKCYQIENILSNNFKTLKEVSL